MCLSSRWDSPLTDKELQVVPWQIFRAQPLIFFYVKHVTASLQKWLLESLTAKQLVYGSHVAQDACNNNDLADVEALFLQFQHPPKQFRLLDHRRPLIPCHTRAVSWNISSNIEVSSAEERTTLLWISKRAVHLNNSDWRIADFTKSLNGSWNWRNNLGRIFQRNQKKNEITFRMRKFHWIVTKFSIILWMWYSECMWHSKWWSFRSYSAIFFTFRHFITSPHYLSSQVLFSRKSEFLLLTFPSPVRAVENFLSPSQFLTNPLCSQELCDQYKRVMVFPRLVTASHISPYWTDFVVMLLILHYSQILDINLRTTFLDCFPTTAVKLCRYVLLWLRCSTYLSGYHMNLRSVGIDAGTMGKSALPWSLQLGFPTRTAENRMYTSITLNYGGLCRCWCWPTTNK